MEQTTMQGLLASDAERVQNTLRAGQSVDRSRESALRTLGDELGALLLRYNAACVDDPERQAVADAMTAAARDGLEVLLAGKTELTPGRKETRPGAPWLLLLALTLGAAAIWLLPRYAPAGWIGCALALLCAYLSGRLWTKEGAPQAVDTLDPERLWAALRKTTETMDCKIDAFSALARERRERERAAEREKLPLDREELALVAELLEALYTDNGDFALRQLRRLLPWLRARGVETADYGAETAELFELLPSRSETVTLRPALLHEGKLLLTGRAAAPQD